MSIFNIKVQLDSYIGHPYWMEMDQVINITKESGMNRARSSEGRRKSLEQHLSGINMSYAEWEELLEKANRPFHTDEDGLVVIPKRHVESMLVQTCYNMRSAGRPCPPEMVRTSIRCTGWQTDCSAEDAHTWTRYAVVNAGTGQKLSNQRSLRENKFIGDNPPDGEPTKPVTATGTIRLNETMVKPEVLEKALIWAGEWVGIGASRKMGWGRWNVINFSPGGLTD